MTTKKLTHKQIMTLVFISLLSPVLRIVPDGTVTFGGKVGWLSPVAALVPILLLYWLIRACMKNRQENEGLGEIILRAFGPWFGRVIMALFIAWLIFYIAFILRVSSERLVISAYTSGGVLFLIVTAVSSAIAASGKVKSLVRTAQVFVPIITVILVIIFVLVGLDIKLENLIPVTFRDIPDVLMGSLHVINAITTFAYFTFLSGYSQHTSGKKSGAGYIIGLVAIAVGVVVTTIGVLSAEIANSLQNPFFIMIRNITFFDVLERIEALVIAFWVISDFMYISSLMMISGEIMCVTVKSKKRWPWVWLIAGAAFALSVFISRTSLELEHLSVVVVPAINLGFTFLLIPIIMVVAKIRKVL